MLGCHRSNREQDYSAQVLGRSQRRTAAKSMPPHSLGPRAIIPLSSRRRRTKPTLACAAPARFRAATLAESQSEGCRRRSPGRSGGDETIRCKPSRARWTRLCAAHPCPLCSQRGGNCWGPWPQLPELPCPGRATEACDPVVQSWPASPLLPSHPPRANDSLAVGCASSPIASAFDGRRSFASPAPFIHLFWRRANHVLSTNRARTPRSSHPLPPPVVRSRDCAVIALRCEFTSHLPSSLLHT
jgi:hypothetical protein